MDDQRLAGLARGADVAAESARAAIRGRLPAGSSRARFPDGDDFGVAAIATSSATVGSGVSV
jgi:hypothetical protein